jgi:hypothetical protein
MRDIARVAAALLAAVVLGRNVAVAGGVPAIVTATYLAGAVVLVAMTLFRDGFLTASAVALAAHYTLSLHYGDVSADLGAPVIAALIVVHLDLLDLAALVPRERTVDSAFVRSRLRHAATVFAVGAVASVLALAVASVRWPSTTLTRALGVAGIALVAVIPLGMLRARR